MIYFVKLDIPAFKNYFNFELLFLSMKRRDYFTTIGALSVTGVLAGCSGEDDEEPTENNDDSELEEGDNSTDETNTETEEANDETEEREVVFEFTEATPQSESFSEGQEITVAATVENTGSIAGEQAVELEIQGETSETNTELESGEDTTVGITFEWSDFSPGTVEYTFTSADDEISGSFEIEEAPEAVFELSDVIADGETYSMDEEVVIGATVENTGDAPGSQTIEIDSDWYSYSEELELEPGENTEFGARWETAADIESDEAVGDLEYTIRTDDDEIMGSLTIEEPEEVEAVVGSLIESDDMALVVEDFERGVNLGEFVEPDDGNEFASASVALKNTSDDFVSVSNLLQTRIRDDENYSYDQTLFSGDEPSFNDGQFAPGEVERGAINFEIPEDATGLTLVWDFNSDLFTGLERALIDVEEETAVHTLEQNLQIDVYDVGTTVEFEDTEVTVNEMRTEEELGRFTEPETGNEYVIVDISIENQTGEQQRVSTAIQMMIKDGDGYSYQEDLGATVELDRAFDETSPIGDGETRRGEVVYEVEEGLSPLYWVFEFSLWNDGDKTFWELR